MKLSDREWGEFKIGELFKVSGTITTHPSILIKGGNIPRITCSATNNGLDSFYENYPTEKGGVITVDSATIGFTSYQNCDFLATDHVEKISFKNGKKITCFQGLFIKQAIDKAVDKKYNYGYKFSQGRIRKQIILLPITSEGKPDYEFMEEYIKEIINKKRQKYIEYVKDKIKSLKVVGGGQSLENTNWIEFKISDVFLLKASNSGIDKNKLIDGSEKNIPYITRSNLSNGIFSFVYKKQGLKYKLDEGNQISIGLDTQTVFYQPYKFYTGQNIQTINNDFLNKYNSLFVVKLLEFQLKKFNWGGNGATLSRLLKTKILLPATQQNQPDYKFMENYIKNKMSLKYNKYLEYIKNK